MLHTSLTITRKNLEFIFNRFSVLIQKTVATQKIFDIDYHRGILTLLVLGQNITFYLEDAE